MRWRTACLLLLASCTPTPSARVPVVADPRFDAAGRSALQQSPARPPSADGVAAENEGCDAGDRQACAALAERCRIGSTGKVKWESAACAERERKACDAGDPAFCRKLSDRYTDVTDDVGVTKDETMAAMLLERACEGGGSMDDCTQIASRYEMGRGVPENAGRAVHFLQRACDGDGGVSPPSCARLADYLSTGTAVAKDEARAARLYLAACRNGFCSERGLRELCADAGGKAKTHVGCVALALTLTMPVAGAPEMNPRRARSLLERACQRREAEACRELGRWFAEGRQWPDGTSTARDPIRAEALLRQACTVEPNGCKGP